MKLRADVCLLVIVLLWRWWDVRNKVNAGELMPACQETVRAVIGMVHVLVDLYWALGSAP